MTPTISFDTLEVDCIFTSHWTNCLLGQYLIIFYWSDSKNWNKKKQQLQEERAEILLVGLLNSEAIETDHRHINVHLQ